MSDVIIVGAGVFGSVMARELRDKGRSVLVIDADLPESASKSAAFLMKPLWFKSLGQQITRPALELLDRLYGIEDLSFRLRFSSASVYNIDPRKVLLKHYVNASVTAITQAQGGWAVHCGPATVFHANKVVVAAGAWTPTLAQVNGGIEGHGYMAFLWPQRRVDPFVNCWKPYRQVVAFNRWDGLWVSDNHPFPYSRLVENNTQIKAMQHQRRYLFNTEVDRMKWEEKSFARCANALGGDTSGHIERFFSLCPYIKSKQHLLDEVAPGLWVALGGVKNGAISAAYCAYEFEKKTQ